MQALFGRVWVEDVTRWSDGKTATRQVERPCVSIHKWMNGLEPGDGWLRRAPIDRGWGQDRIRIARPTRKRISEMGRRASRHPPACLSGRSPCNAVVGRSPQAALPGADYGLPTEQPQPSLPSPPPACPPALRERMGADVLAKVEERWASPRRELGLCLVWREGEPTIRAAGRVYGRIYDPAIKRTDAAHLVVGGGATPRRPSPKG